MESTLLSLRQAWSTIIEALKGEDKDYTRLPLNKAIALLSVPMVIEMVMESLFAVVDIYFVAQVGEEAVTTVGLTESVMFLVYSLAIGIATAATAMVARRVGEKKPGEAAIAAGQAFLLALIIATLVGVSGFLFAEDILRLMGAERAVLEKGAGYTRIMFGGNVVIMLLFLINGIFRGVGNAMLAMVVLLIANGINIILDPCLILGLGPFPKLGVEGAAIATNIGRAIGVLVQLYFLFRGVGVIKLVAGDFGPRLHLMWRLIKVGAGGTGQFLISSASWIFLMRIVAEYGTSVVSGYTIAIRLIIFAILPAFGMANAAATLVGQNLGADQPEEAAKAAWKTSYVAMVYLFVISVGFFLAAPQILRWFDDSATVIDAGVTCLRIVCPGYILFAFGMVLSQCLNGAGDTRTPTLINLFVFWAIQIPLAWTLATLVGMEQEGVYTAIVISETVYALVCIWIFRMGRWKLTVI